MKQDIDIQKVLGDFGLADLKKEVFDKNFIPKDLGISSRALHNWSENNLLIDKERAYDMNHKFNFIELIWLLIIKELRVFGFPLKKIKTVKEFLVKEKTFAQFKNWNTDEEIIEGICNIWIGVDIDRGLLKREISKSDVLNNIKTRKFSALQFALYNYINDRTNSKILISNKGEAGFRVGDMSPRIADMLDRESYISIPVYKLVLNFIEDEKNFELIPHMGLLTATEFHILSVIRSGLFNSVTINFKKGKPIFLEAKRNVNIYKEARIAELLVRKDYEEIVIATLNGVETFSTKTTKEKLL
jgi:DNA-binding transcriptional MerR regulator